MTAGDQHVGPITFGNETARQQLLDHGEVVTFRSEERTTGETWWRKSRTGPKKGDTTVERIGSCTHPSNLAEYVELSGFETVEAWQEAIREVHRQKALRGHLYRVTEGHNGGE